MHPDFINYLWKFCNFSSLHLRLVGGERLHIHHQGVQSLYSPLKFLHAKLTIGKNQQNGTVALYLKSSHRTEPAATPHSSKEPSILCVVWEHDQILYHEEATRLPILELKPYVETTLVQKFQNILSTTDPIPCKKELPMITPLTKLTMIEKSSVRNVQRKGMEVLEALQENNNDWEETCYQLLVQKIGLTVNSGPFKKLALSLPYKILKRHSNNTLQIESLLFGMAGFLHHTYDPYHDKLKNEFDSLAIKYGLTPMINEQEWKFLRLRPNNFPTLRIAQLAAIIADQPHLFNAVVANKEVRALDFLFGLELSEYWTMHYKFGQTSSIKSSKMGKKSIEHLKINFFVPVLVAYGLFMRDRKYINRALSILEKMPPEQNKITRELELAGFQSKRAYDSQGLIEINNEFCMKKKCLYCNIGVAIMN